MKNIQPGKKIPIQIILLTFFDILTKYLFTNKTYFTNFPLFINYSQNYGSALSMFSNITHYNILISILSILVILLLIKYKHEFLRSKKTQIVFILLIAGILGNLYDRLLFGFVRDFIGLKNLFIFNIADLYLTLSALIYIYEEYSNTQTPSL